MHESKSPDKISCSFSVRSKWLPLMGKQLVLLLDFEIAKLVEMMAGRSVIVLALLRKEYPIINQESE